jgi:hypothetical protein
MQSSKKERYDSFCQLRSVWGGWQENSWGGGGLGGLAGRQLWGGLAGRQLGGGLAGRQLWGGAGRKTAGGGAGRKTAGGGGGQSHGTGKFSDGYSLFLFGKPL